MKESREKQITIFFNNSNKNKELFKGDDYKKRKIKIEIFRRKEAKKDFPRVAKK